MIKSSIFFEKYRGLMYRMPVSVQNLTLIERLYRIERLIDKFKIGVGDIIQLNGLEYCVKCFIDLEDDLCMICYPLKNKKDECGIGCGNTNIVMIQSNC